MINYAQKIREYRERKLLTQQEFAKLLGVSIPCITRWENGKFEPTMAVKRKLRELFIEAGMKVED